jgi:hypothetical protein
MFGTNYGRRVEEEVKWAGRELKGTFTDFNKLQMGKSHFSNLEPFIKRYIDKCLK